MSLRPQRVSSGRLCGPLGRRRRVARLLGRAAVIPVPAAGAIVWAALIAAVMSPGAARAQPSRTTTPRASADLIVSSLSSSSRRVRVGAPFEVTVRVRNHGNRTAPRSSVGFYLARAATKGNAINLTRRATIIRLKPGQTSPGVRTIVRIPVTTPPGHWRLLGCVHPHEKVHERHAGTNCRAAARPIIVTAPPGQCQEGLTANGWASSEETIDELPASIPQAPFEAKINGTSIGTARLLAFAQRLGKSTDFPQALVIYSSGYLRLRPAADPGPAFGQSLVLGPAIWGTTPSFPATTFFSNPQVQQVDIDTSALDATCHGALKIHIVADHEGPASSSPATNQIMNLAWDVVLAQPTTQATEIHVSGTFAFTEQITPDLTRTAEFQSFKLFQISSMYIDADHHDVDAFRYRDASGPVAVSYSPGLLGQLVPETPTAIDSQTPVLDSVQSTAAQPNGTTPSYRITLGPTSGPMAAPTTPRAWLASTADVNQDNVGLWAYQRPVAVIPAGATGEIQFTLDASGHPLPPP